MPSPCGMITGKVKLKERRFQVRRLKREAAALGDTASWPLTSQIGEKTINIQTNVKFFLLFDV